MKTSQRVVELMDAYGATELGSALIDSKDVALKLQRALRELIDDELTQWQPAREENAQFGKKRPDWAL